MIKVLHSGIYLSVQDLGRIGVAKKGIPQGGVLDSYAAKMANALLKNNVSDAVIEITFGLGKFEFTTDTIICLVGGDFSPKLNATSIAMNAIVEVKKGDVLLFGKRNYGVRVYLAVKGGIQSEVVLKSRSFFQGLTPKIRLKKGDILNINKTIGLIENKHARIKINHDRFSLEDIRCYKGPEYDQLNQVQKRGLKNTFSISEDNNRVGYRLKEIVENNLTPILTSAVLPGTVQLTPSGKLIILMRDCQVTGGYPRVLQLTNESIDRLSQKMTNDTIRFVLT